MTLVFSTQCRGLCQALMEAGGGVGFVKTGSDKSPCSFSVNLIVCLNRYFRALHARPREAPGLSAGGL
jgi:hypothetical protein